MEWRCCNHLIRWGNRPLVMGVLNATPDSFSDGGAYMDPLRAVDRAFELEAQGADVIDIGGESTRPGAEVVSEEEELKRVIPVIQALSGKLKIPISVDTTKSSVARQSLDLGAVIINDVSGGLWDQALWPTVAKAGAGYVLMHSQGRPKTMQTAPEYTDVVQEVAAWTKKSLSKAIDAGISLDGMVVDVGIGFGKTVEHNWALLKSLNRFLEFGRPLLIGVSRKSFLRHTAGDRSLESATVAAQVFATMNGASIWRVHDVVSAVAAAKVVEVMMNRKDVERKGD